LETEKLGLNNSLLSIDAELSKSQRWVEKRIRKELALTNIFRNIAQKVVAYDDFVESFLDDPDTFENPIPAIERFKVDTLEKYLLPILDETAKLFTILSKNKCAACIKVRSPDSGERSAGNHEYLSVITWGRDSTSAAIRLYDEDTIKGLHEYRHSSNTAFKTIIESEETDFWGSNDLNAMGGEYLNVNPDRSKLYNATIVSGLRDPLSKRNEPPGINGFLCIDNKHGNLNNRLSESVMGILSYYMYNIIRKFSGIDYILADVFSTVPDIATNNMHVALILSQNPSFQIMIGGGQIRNHDGGIVGPETTQFMNDYRLDLGIIGISGIDEEGTLLDYDLNEVRTSKIIIQNSKHVILVTDSSKFGKRALYKVGALSDIDELVTDMNFPDKYRGLIEKADVNLIQVNREEY